MKKKFLAACAATITFALVSVSTTVTAYASDMPMPMITEEEICEYLDFNHNGVNDIGDAVCSWKLLEEGKVAKADYKNACNILLGEEIAMDYSFIAVNEDTSYDVVKEVFASYIVDLNFSQDGNFATIRVMNDGKITDLCAPIGEVLDPLCGAVFERDYETIAFGMARGGDLMFDTYSFDIPPCESYGFMYELKKEKLENVVATEGSVGWLCDLDRFPVTGVRCLYEWEQPTEVWLTYKYEGGYVELNFGSIPVEKMDEVIKESEYLGRKITFGICHKADDCPEGHLVAYIEEKIADESCVK